MHSRRSKRDPVSRFRPIQEELAGFLLREVMNPQGKHHQDLAEDHGIED